MLTVQRSQNSMNPPVGETYALITHSYSASLAEIQEFIFPIFISKYRISLRGFPAPNPRTLKNTCAKSTLSESFYVVDNKYIGFVTPLTIGAYIFVLSALLLFHQISNLNRSIRHCLFFCFKVSSILCSLRLVKNSNIIGAVFRIKPSLADICNSRNNIYDILGQLL